MKTIVVAATVLMTLVMSANTASARTPREWYPGYNGGYSKFPGAKIFFDNLDRASGGTSF